MTWRWTHRGAGLALLAILLAGGPAAPRAADPETPAAVRSIDDYAAATAAARETAAMLLVSVEPGDPSSDDAVGRRLGDPVVQRRFAAAGTPWIVCRLPRAAAATLVADPALVSLRDGGGVFVVDFAHDSWRGRVVSLLPRAAGRYYRFSAAHVDELADLPAGSLTQRSLILAVRIHPEAPQSTRGHFDPVLAEAATAHAAHQARIRRQGHHGWDARSRRLGGAASEICAQSWEHLDLLDACVDCVASWRQSSGHWNGVRSPQAAYGYDIRRGSNSIWYATGIFIK